MGKVKDLTGRKFGKLSVVSFYKTMRRKTTPTNTIAYWNVVCDCGNTKTVDTRSLQNSISCGCVRLQKLLSMAVKHGRCNTPEHRSWNHMKDRCLNPKSDGYYLYGAKGIEVCDRWLDFENFFADMGVKPTLRHSIDRIDSKGNYEPSNCRWATPKEQANNRKQASIRNLARNYLIWKASNTQSVSSLSQIFNLSEDAIYYTLKKFAV
jgi:hypothetical protein